LRAVCVCDASLHLISGILLIGFSYSKLIEGIKLEAQRRFTFEAFTSQVLEDLFEGCLADAVFLNLHFLLL